ncbi:hypothetical protein [Tenacibaculum aestuariivivum]|uniref:hypothetical protein n=1 Tax=Tenacibaculum aestuariivivum TaxID=2006131 RepID=UPI003AB3E4B1
MPYKPLNLSTFKIDAKVASILEIGQQEYQKTLGVELINEKVTQQVITTKNIQTTKESQKDKKISKIVFDFLFEPKYDNIFTIFSKKTS